MVAVRLRRDRGLEFDVDEGSDEGLLSGVRSQAGTYTLTAEAGDSADPQNTGTRTIKVKVGLGLLPATLAEGRPQGRPRRRGD